MPHSGTITQSEKALVALLRNALWGRSEEGAFHGLTVSEWEKIYAAAVGQGVQAIAFDGMMRLPETLQPPRTLKLQWGINAAAAEKRFNHYLTATRELTAFFHRHGVDTMVLKGVGQALDFSVPDHRESGDIDLWLFGQYEKGMQLATEHFSSVKRGDKHSSFVYDGIIVENHRHFLDVRLFAVNRLLEPRLQILLQDKKQLPRLPNEESHTHEPYLPSADFNALFLLIHTATHFTTCDIRLRHLCDWARFLFVHGDEFDKQAWQKILQDTGLDRIANALGMLATEQLGLPVEYLPNTNTPDRELAAKIWDSILHEKRSIQSRNPLRIICFKIRRFCAIQWKYHAVYGRKGGLATRLRLSIQTHIRYPKNFLKV